MVMNAVTTPAQRPVFTVKPESSEQKKKKVKCAASAKRSVWTEGLLTSRGDCPVMDIVSRGEARAAILLGEQERELTARYVCVKDVALVQDPICNCSRFKKYSEEMEAETYHTRTRSRCRKCY
jgi:hypothetical protein